MKKELKETEKDREIYALRHQISTKDKQIKQLDAEIKIANARTDTQAIINGYLLHKLSPNKEVEISTEELTHYMAEGNEAVWNENDGIITIKIVKKSL